jgi:hypothetical protein
MICKFIVIAHSKKVHNNTNTWTIRLLGSIKTTTSYSEKFLMKLSNLEGKPAK